MKVLVKGAAVLLKMKSKGAVYTNPNSRDRRGCAKKLPFSRAICMVNALSGVWRCKGDSQLSVLGVGRREQVHLLCCREEGGLVGFVGAAHNNGGRGQSSNYGSQQISPGLRGGQGVGGAGAGDVPRP